MAISADVRQQVYDLLSKASNLSFVSADQESDVDEGSPSGLVPGQRVMAEVLSILPDSRVQVQTGAGRFNLNLPMEARPGQNLEMTFVASDPRPTFAIARPGAAAPPVGLSDASRLLGLLVDSEQPDDPVLRSSFQSIGDMLRRSSGEAGVLANLMDEALTYGGILRDSAKSAPLPSAVSMQQPVQEPEAAPEQAAAAALTPEQARLAAFESTAGRILQQIAGSSRFTLVEAANQPLTPLPLMPGETVDALVTGNLPGGRVFVQVAGTSMELALPRAVASGELVRLTYISSLPKPLFAIGRNVPESMSGAVSEAGRWLSALEHGAGGVSSQQLHVLERLNSILKSLPPGSPAFAAIADEAITYENAVLEARRQAGQNQQAGAAAAAAAAMPAAAQQAALQQGNGIVLSDDMARLLQSLIKGNRLALLEALNQQTTSDFTPGQQLKGEVLAALGGGRFMLELAGRSFEFNMPKGIGRGDLLNFFFIAADPKPVFLMTRFGRPGDSHISDTGRWLSGFFGAATQSVASGPAMGILRTLLSGPPADAGQLGSMLRQGLRESGLFYESHLARWFGGDYPLEDILREPQGRLSHPRLAAADPPPRISPEELVRTGVKTGSLEVMEAAVKRAGTALAHEGAADQRTLPVVREQLDALRTGAAVYHGELFPGQQMEWSVSEREARRNSSGEQERSWDTTMRLELPGLGVVSASLSLKGNQVGVSLLADNAASAALLDAGRPALAEQLQASGLMPGEIGVRHGGE